MGIEPTYDAVHAPYSDFEDRGHHQVCKHFQIVNELKCTGSRQWEKEGRSRRRKEEGRRQKEDLGA